METVETGGPRVARTLYDFVNNEALPGTGVDPAAFWTGYGALIRDLGPRCQALLDKRAALQKQIDGWHLANRRKVLVQAEYQAFLRSIGYLLDEPADFAVATTNVDPETATLAGPQLVVPVTNVRYSLNATYSPSLSLRGIYSPAR